jgi:uncharacterized protein
LTINEARSVAQKLGIDWERFLNEYTDRRWPGTRSYLLKHVDGACIFLSRTSDKYQKLCSIHEIKPACCREWTADPKNPECSEGLRTLWGLTVDPSGQICGSQEKIEKFRNYTGITGTNEK